MAKRNVDSPEQTVYNALQAAVEALSSNKPNDGGDVDARYTVALQEAEKVFAYFNTFVVIPSKPQE